MSDERQYQLAQEGRISYLLRVVRITSDGWKFTDHVGPFPSMDELSAYRDQMRLDCDHEIDVLHLVPPDLFPISYTKIQEADGTPCNEQVL